MSLLNSVEFSANYRPPTNTWIHRRARHWAFEDEARSRIAAIEQEIKDNYAKEKMDEMPPELRTRKPRSK